MDVTKANASTMESAYDTGSSALTEKKPGSSTADRVMGATRVFDAPRDLVFQMFTDANHVSEWWGPRGFRTTTHEMDLRPGGVWRHTMHGPDGRDYPNKVVYVEVARPERLIYDHVSPPPFRTTVTFAARGNTTEVNMCMVFESAELRNRVEEEYGAVEGLHHTLERFGEMLLANR